MLLLAHSKFRLNTINKSDSSFSRNPKISIPHIQSSLAPSISHVGFLGKIIVPRRWFLSESSTSWNSLVREAHDLSSSRSTHWCIQVLCLLKRVSHHNEVPRSLGAYLSALAEKMLSSLRLAASCRCLSSSQMRRVSPLALQGILAYPTKDSGCLSSKARRCRGCKLSV